MDTNLEQLIKQADELKAGLEAMHKQSKRMGYNVVGIRESAETIQKCLKKVGNNKLAALAARDKRKVYDEMEEAVEQLLELIS